MLKYKINIKLLDYLDAADYLYPVMTATLKKRFYYIISYKLDAINYAKEHRISVLYASYLVGNRVFT